MKSNDARVLDTKAAEQISKQSIQVLTWKHSFIDAANIRVFETIKCLFGVACHLQDGADL
jgi:hypothetical protein